VRLIGDPAGNPGASKKAGSSKDLAFPDRSPGASKRRAFRKLAFSPVRLIGNRAQAAKGYR
jgi:hypothetical protein